MTEPFGHEKLIVHLKGIPHGGITHVRIGH
jgi:hypothetical protein